MSDTFGREIPYEIMFSKNDSPLPEKISSPNTAKRSLNIQFRNKNITVYYLSFTFNEIHLFDLLQLHQLICPRKVAETNETSTSNVRRVQYPNVKKGTRDIPVGSNNVSLKAGPRQLDFKSRTAVATSRC